MGRGVPICPTLFHMTRTPRAHTIRGLTPRRMGTRGLQCLTQGSCGFRAASCRGSTTPPPVSPTAELDDASW